MMRVVSLGGRHPMVVLSDGSLWELREGSWKQLPLPPPCVEFQALRDPPPAESKPFDVPDLVAETAEAELRLWAGNKEEDPEVAAYLAEYWRHAGLGAQPPSVPWSAAFVCYCVRSVSPAALKPSASHWGYCRHAHLERPPDAYRAFPASTRPRRGDIVVRVRDGHDAYGLVVPAGLSSLEKHDYVPAHGSIVTRIETHARKTGMPATVVAIGGNSGNTVAEERYVLTPDGALRSPFILCVLRYVESGNG